MGLCASSSAQLSQNLASGTKTSKYAAGEQRSEFDVRVSNALKEYKAKLESAPKSERVKSFNQVLIRSGKIRKGFDVIKGVFQKFDVDASDSIDHSELVEALKVLGNENVTSDEVKKVFHEADLYANGILSLKEFIVCTMVGYVLGHVKLAEDPQDESADSVYSGKAADLKLAFHNIIGAYLLFDEDASGDLSRDEVLQQLKAKKGVFSDAAAVNMMTESRWKELDWDGDGRITFREFVWAFQKWISLDDE